MKKISILGVALAALLMTVSCTTKKDADAMAQHSVDSMQQIVNAKDGEINALFDVLNQIEDNLSLISAKYSNVQEMKRGNVESNYNVKGEITTQVNTIEKMLAENKKKIAELNKKIATMGKESKQLQEYIAKLETRMADQEKQINDLTSDLQKHKMLIANLNQTVDTLTTQNQKKDEVIARQTVEANKAYFIVGTYKELKELGVVSKSGGFIGIGKKQNAVGDMPTDHFTTIDRTKVTTITVGQKKAVVISKHPADSYQLVMDDSDPSVVAYLKVLNPASFWKYTRYLVISTK
jgi:uncharacterized coiled-coil protein SlyX